MDAKRRARKGWQGGINSVSDQPARERTALKTVFVETGRIRTRSGESFGKTGADGEVVSAWRPECWRQVLWRCVRPTGFWMRLPDDVVREVFPWEEFVLARSLVDTGVADGEVEDDLFAGLRAPVRT